MKRYDIEEHESNEGGWIRYEDYENEQTAFFQFMRFLIALHQASETFGNDSDAANLIRDNMDVLWPQLSDAQRGFTHVMSAELIYHED